MIGVVTNYLVKSMAVAVVLMFSASLSMADQLEIKLGLVKKGAFLLSEIPDTLKDGLMVHSLVGYLPTGSRVVVEDKYTVTNLVSSDDEVYYFVKSEVGQSGLLREDLLIQANGRRLAVSIASFPIQVHQPNATLEKPSKRFTLGRHGGDYFEVVGETENGFYDVILHRENHKQVNLPATEKARLKKLYVDKNQVSLLDSDDGLFMREFNKAWNSTINIKGDYFTGIMNTIKNKVGGDLDKITSLIGDINNLQCLVDGSFEGELGFKVFSNGFSLNLNAELKKTGIKYLFDTKKLSTGTTNKYYSGISAIKCDGMTPKRLQQLTIQEGIYSARKRFTINLGDLEKSKSPWITTLHGNNKSTKMVKISGWNDYNQLMKELNSYAVNGDGYLSELPEKTRLVLLNYIISRIGYFEHRDLRI